MVLFVFSLCGGFFGFFFFQIFLFLTLLLVLGNLVPQAYKNHLLDISALSTPGLHRLALSVQKAILIPARVEGETSKSSPGVSYAQS